MASAENRPPALVVRGRVDADLDEVVAIMAGVRDRDGYPMHWPADPAGWLAGARLIGAWVAALDGRIAGHVSLFRLGRGDYAPALTDAAPVAAAAMVSRLFVAPTARGHRAGAALLDQAVHAARDLGCQPLLDVRSANTAAIALYERRGWRLLGCTEDVWGEDRVTILSYAAPPG
ncbi:MAG TPA: GNAT family N-acetyltransferase [Streptosporangiaceae bacterium]|jgi:GNAT superfamily N-acetyltransferase